ncbi:pPIWI_RE_Z domain-containing protein [Kitasatospora sp. NPDC004289]
MRSTVEPFRDVVGQLHERAPEPKPKPERLRTLCEVELGLHLQQLLLPGDPAEAAWPLFSGHPYLAAREPELGSRSADMLRKARYSLWTLARPAAWAEALQEYQRWPVALRGFDVPDPTAPARRIVNLTVAEDRWGHYDRLLAQAPPWEARELPMAGAGPHGFALGRFTTTVRLEEVPGPRPKAHDLAILPAGAGAPLTVDKAELLVTAARMDELEHRDWHGRLDRISFSTPSGDGFEPAGRFTVAGLQHLLGIVGAGKSTLRDVLTVHLARLGLRVAVVVGDVAELLKLVRLYNLHLGPEQKSAAPVIGASSREQHAERLHRRLAGRGDRNLLGHHDPAFDYLSTSCAVNALRAEQAGDGPEDVPELLAFADAPCTTLRPRASTAARSTDGERWQERRRACPYWSRCPRHRGARELVDADVWVATPAGLVDSRVPWVQNGERLRYLELAARRSDLVIVDEVDRVQIQLDQMFAPAVVLADGVDGDDLVSELNAHRGRELTGGGRIQLSNRDVENWSVAVSTVNLATDRLYARLAGEPRLRKRVSPGYFSARYLQEGLLAMRYPTAVEESGEGGGPKAASPPDEAVAASWAKARADLSERLKVFRENPFGDRSPSRPGDVQLTGLMNELLQTTYQANTRPRLAEFVVELLDLEPVLRLKRAAYEAELARREAERELRRAQGRTPRTWPTEPRSAEDWLDEQALLFEFTLLLCALEPRLALVNAMWPRVQVALNLGFSLMYRRPPDYGPIVPEEPMGNMLAFQFLVHGREEGGLQNGQLRFFRCSGMGRELLRVLPGLPTVDNRPGTNVLLMSGSSWAGTSSRYHVPVPIGVIIEPDRSELDRIAELSEFRIEFAEIGGRPATVSGSDQDQRTDLLCRMVTAVGAEDDDGTGSRLRRELAALPDERRHILLLVGSYEEAREVADTLHGLGPRWRGRVLRLASDDDHTVPDELSIEGDEHHAGVLRRGDVETLADTPAEILVAPLLAVERGHNILNKEQQAAIGTVYFLVRPNPRPDDLGLAVHAVNDWQVRAVASGDFAERVAGESSLDQGARAARAAARAEWHRLLARSLAWSRLGADREPVTWDLMVLIWQVIGRLLRGAVPARVVFVDAAFAPGRAAVPPEPDTPRTSLLHSMLDVLDPYCLDDRTPEPGGPAPEAVAPLDPADRYIVRALYGPLHAALGRCLRLGADRREAPGCTP